MSQPVTTIEELWREVMKNKVPKSKDYYKAEYYMGQAVATYGADKLIKSYNENLKK